MDELACFVPGTLALGSSDYDSENAEILESLAEEVLLLIFEIISVILLCYFFSDMKHAWTSSTLKSPYMVPYGQCKHKSNPACAVYKNVSSSEHIKLVKST